MFGCCICVCLCMCVCMCLCTMGRKFGSFPGTFLIYLICDNLISTIHYLLFSLQCLHQNDCQNCIYNLRVMIKKSLFLFKVRWVKNCIFVVYVEHCQRHGQSGSPDRFIFQIPSELVNASISEGMAGDCIATFYRQRLSEIKVILWSLWSAACNLSAKRWKQKKNEKRLKSSLDIIGNTRFI